MASADEELAARCVRGLRRRHERHHEELELVADLGSPRVTVRGKAYAGRFDYGASMNVDILPASRSTDPDVDSRRSGPARCPRSSVVIAVGRPPANVAARAWGRLQSATADVRSEPGAPGPGPPVRGSLDHLV